MKIQNVKVALKVNSNIAISGNWDEEKFDAEFNIGLNGDVNVKGIGPFGKKGEFDLNFNLEVEGGVEVEETSTEKLKEIEKKFSKEEVERMITEAVTSTLLKVTK